MTNRWFKVVGHRGMPSCYPENTLVSFEQAIAAGVDAIEFDVRLTRDRKMVVTHDDTVDRCSNGHGPVNGFTLAELRQLDFGGWKSPEFRGTTIPTFEETLDTILARCRPDFQILIELKEDDEECTRMVWEELRRRGIVERCVILSFYANQLELLRQWDPVVLLQGFPLEKFVRPVPQAYDFLMRLCIWKNALTAEQVEFFHGRNIQIDVCPVDNAEHLTEISRFDVDTITTNAADVIMPLLRERGLRPPELPETMSAWRLYGAGMDNFGDENRPGRLPLPTIRRDEILVRIDAIGLCFSDVKIILAGAGHPKLQGRDLRRQPLIPGHEAVVTVVRAGDGVPVRFAPGRRFIVQCDVFVGGQSCAYGYGMDGGMAEYGVIDRRVWEGDGRSYLLDCPERLSDTAAALIEPWTCVMAAYQIEHRATPVAGGRVLVVTDSGNRKIYRAGELFREARPRRVTAVNFSAEAVTALTSELQCEVVTASDVPAGEEFDDIVCCNLRSRELGERAVAAGARFAVISFIGDFGDEAWRIDVGALHYRNYYYQGEADGDFSAPYRRERRRDLRPSGCAWFVGGAGAMGQMHVQLAASSPVGPNRILVTDLDDRRIEHVRKMLLPYLAKRSIELEFINPSRLSKDEFEQRLADFAPGGFDDVVMLVPSAEQVELAAEFLAPNGLLNVFAGIPAGKTARLRLTDIVNCAVRYTGSSGSSTDDMIHTIELAASGWLRPEGALAAIGGMNALKEGLEAVAAGKFTGKTVILPDCPDLPLVALAEFGRFDAELASTLDSDGLFTPAGEAWLRSHRSNRR